MTRYMYAFNFAACQPINHCFPTPISQTLQGSATKHPNRSGADNINAQSKKTPMNYLLITFARVLWRGWLALLGNQCKQQSYQALNPQEYHHVKVTFTTDLVAISRFACEAEFMCFPAIIKP